MGVMQMTGNNNSPFDLGFLPKVSPFENEVGFFTLQITGVEKNMYIGIGDEANEGARDCEKQRFSMHTGYQVECDHMILGWAEANSLVFTQD